MSQPARRGRTVLLVLAAFAGGLIFARPLTAGRFNPYQKLGVFTKVLSYIEGHYVEDSSETDLMYGAARGLTDVLDSALALHGPGGVRTAEEGDRGQRGDRRHRHRRREAQEPVRDHLADRRFARRARRASSRATSSSASTASRSSTLEFDEAVARMQGPGGSEVTLVIERRGREHDVPASGARNTR